MKKLFFLALSALLFTAAYSQNDTTPSPVAPYLRFPTFPPVVLLLPDSTNHFTKDNLDKKMPVMLMIFNPQCEHCQHETEELVKHMDEFKHVQIVMATMMSFEAMNGFREKYKLNQYDNIIVGQDQHYFLPGFYKLSNLPFLAFYNKKKELISVFEGSMPMEKVIAELKK